MERARRPRETAVGGPGGGLPGAAVANGGPVTICHGPYSEELPVAGMTVGEIRVTYGDRFDLDPLSQAVLNGREVNEDARVDTGLLMFVRRAGEKGCEHLPAGIVP